MGAVRVAGFKVSSALVTGVFLGLGNGIGRRETRNPQSELTETLKRKYAFTACSSDLDTVLPSTKTLGTHLESEFILGS